VGLTTIGTPTQATIVSGGAVYGFDATAGQSVTLSVTGNTIPGVTLTVLDSTSAVVATLVVPGDAATSGAFTLSTTGTYVLTIASPGPPTGTLTFTLNPN
jgi:hypothetical protein